MSDNPIKLTLYNDEMEPLDTFSRGFIPWKILKSALRLQHLAQGDMTEEDIDKINQLVVDFYGNKFTIEQLENGATLEEVLAVVMAIMTRLEGDLPGLGGANPTLPGKS